MLSVYSMSKFHLVDLSLVPLYVVFQYHMDVFVVTICFLYKTVTFLVIKLQLKKTVVCAL